MNPPDVLYLCWIMPKSPKSWVVSKVELAGSKVTEMLLSTPASSARSKLIDAPQELKASASQITSYTSSGSW